MTLAEAIHIVYHALLTRYTREQADCGTAMFVGAMLGDLEEQ